MDVPLILVPDRDGKLDGELIVYIAGQARTKLPFVAGVRHGEMHVFDEQGHLAQTSQFVNGQQEGETVQYYGTGQVQETATYRKNALHGETVKFYENGKVRERAQYENGKLVGQPIPYDHKGKDQKTEMNLQKQVARLNKATAAGMKTWNSLKGLFK